jgi:Tol biopolymer transport system component
VDTGAVSVDAGPLAWSADGRLAYLLYDARGQASIAVVGSTNTPTALAGLLPQGSRVQGLAWSPDGTRFAFTATDTDGIGEVYTVEIDGKNLTQLTKSIGAVGSVSWR